MTAFIDERRGELGAPPWSMKESVAAFSMRRFRSRSAVPSRGRSLFGLAWNQCSTWRGARNREPTGLHDPCGMRSRCTWHLSRRSADAV